MSKVLYVCGEENSIILRNILLLSFEDWKLWLLLKPLFKEAAQRIILPTSLIQTLTYHCLCHQHLLYQHVWADSSISWLEVTVSAL